MVERQFLKRKGRKPMITVYSKPNCSGCEGTKKYLNSKGIEFQVKDISRDPSALDEVLEMGYTSVPVVKTENDHWAGLNLQKLGELV